MAISGDSAGANLTVATNLRLRVLNEPVLAVQLFHFGIYDRARSESDSYKRYDGPKYQVTADEMHFFRKNYVRDDRDLDDPLVYPLHVDLHGLSPSFLAIAE